MSIGVVEREPQRPTLTAIVVNYRSLHDVLKLAAELSADPAAASGAFELIVVDNASLGPDEGLELERMIGVRLVRRPGNDGFAAGVNEGLVIARGRWVLLVNPDVVAGVDLPSRVLGRVEAYEARSASPPGIVGFALCNSDGTPQPSIGPFPSLVGCVREALLPRERRKYQPDWRPKAGPVPWVTGACMLVRSDLLVRLGGLDADFFLYHEEVALCRRSWDLGEAVEFDPSVEVVHLRPLQARRVAPTLRVITRHSKLLYFRKHLPGWQFEGLAAIVALEGTIRGMVAWARGRVAEHRAWGLVARLPATVRGPHRLRGTAVRELAERVVYASDRPALIDLDRPRRSR